MSWEEDDERRFLNWISVKELTLNQIEAWNTYSYTSITFWDDILGSIEIVVIPHGIVVGLRAPVTNRWYMVERKMNAKYLFDTLNILGSIVMWRFQCPNSRELRVYYDTKTQLFSYRIKK